MRKIVIGGSTGSIGAKALSVIDDHPDDLKVHALIARSRKEIFLAQIEKYRPAYVIFGEELQLPGGTKQIPEKEFAEALGHADLFLNAVSGINGMEYTYIALASGKKVALANKESLVAGFEKMLAACKTPLDLIIPVDSEHSAIFQLLSGVRSDDVEKVILTASGGKIRNKDLNRELLPQEILEHPKWRMGSVITIDSSTMVNKAYETAEAHYLFNVPLKNIEVLFHPQAVIHGMIKMKDKNIFAHLSPTDMMYPIKHALFYPNRVPYEKDFNYSVISELTLEPVNFNYYPNYGLFTEALQKSPKTRTALICGNERSVDHFLRSRIKFTQIFELNRYIYEHWKDQGDLEFGELPEIRSKVDTIIENYFGGIQ